MEIVLESGWEEQIVGQYSVVLTSCSHAGMQEGVGRNSVSHSKGGNAQRESVCAKRESVCACAWIPSSRFVDWESCS